MTSYYQVEPIDTPLSPSVKPPTPAYSMHSLSSAKYKITPREDVPRMKLVLMHVLLWVVIFAYAILCPFTKVEESFNVQAIHDIVTFGIRRDSLAKYDHFQYPGVVPRTFIGALLVSPLVRLFAVLLRGRLSNPIVSVRLAMALVGSLATSYFVSGASQALGKSTALLTAALMFTPFHFNYYLSRTLPNTFASITCT